MQYLKRKHFSYRIQLHTGKVWFIWKKLKKSHFYFFLSKFLLTWCLQSQIFQICAKKFKNWVALCFGNVLKLKVTKGELDISIRLEMADDYRLGGARGAPPASFRVNGCLHEEEIEPLINHEATCPFRAVHCPDPECFDKLLEKDIVAHVIR